jgi:TRAP-type mannitol/chloroaromatic compound transport system substrate-binding protein
MVLGLHKAASYYYYPGFHEPGTALSLVFSKKLWDGLGQTEKNVIEAAAAGENNYSLAEYNAKNAAALQELAKDPNIQIRKFDDTILRALGKTAGDVLAESSRKDEMTRRVYESFMTFRKAAVRWGEISERSYLNARGLDFAFGQ